MRALFKLRCGNLKEGNKSWVDEHIGKIVYSVVEEKIIYSYVKHYVEECSEIREKFTKLEKENERILSGCMMRI